MPPILAAVLVGIAWALPIISITYRRATGEWRPSKDEES